MSSGAIERAVRVGRPPAEAFEVFTEGIDRWWPLKEFSYGGDRSVSIHLEPWVGGRFYERLVDGDTLTVGTVTHCDPPGTIVFSWAAPGWPAQTEVTVRFSESSGGTEVELSHRFFDRIGPDGDELRAGFSGGWTTVLGRFTAVADGDG